jgi:quercetin dioxygenase-like cupin family protein
MLETIYKFNKSNDKLIEKLAENSILAINHIVLPPLEVLPEHLSTANLYLIIINGNITLKLGQQQPSNYTKGNIINIPLNTMMKIENLSNELLEFFVIKSLA